MVNVRKMRSMNRRGTLRGWALSWKGISSGICVAVGALLFLFGPPWWVWVIAMITALLVLDGADQFIGNRRKPS